MRARRNRDRLADGAGRVASSRRETGLTEPRDRGIEVARQQMEVRQSRRKVRSHGLQLEECVTARLIVGIDSLGIRGPKTEGDSKPDDVLVELRRCRQVLRAD